MLDHFPLKMYPIIGLRIINEKKTIVQAIILFSIFIFCTFIFFHYHLTILFTDQDKAITFIKSFGPLSIVVFIFLQILQVVLAPIPGEVTGIIGGYLFGPILGTLYSTLGLTAGSWLAFSLANAFGEPFVEKVVKAETLNKFDGFLEHKGGLVIFFLFLIPGFPKDYLCYILGLSNMRAWPFMIISTGGRLLGTISLSLIGDFAKNRDYRSLFVIIILCCMVFIIAYLYHDKILNKLKGHDR
jgi:uncharacterized membrane protein YdjX (TVP38/TMEM64 family)